MTWRTRAAVVTMLMAGAAAFGRAMPQTVPAGLAEARAFVVRGQYDEAVGVLRALIKDHPEQAPASAHKLLGYAFLRLNDPKQSLAEYTRAAAMERPDSRDLENVAKDYVLLNDLTSAATWMAESIKISPADPEGWYGMGRIRFGQQRFAEAVQCFQQSLKLQPESVKAENNLGLAYEGMNRQDDAVKAYRQAIAWQQGTPQRSEQPLLNLGIVLVQRGELTEAEQLLNEAVLLAPKDARVHEQLGHLYLGQSRLDDASAHLKTAIALDEKRPALHFLLGKVYHQQGNEVEARREFALASSLSGYRATPDPF